MEVLNSEKDRAVYSFIPELMLFIILKLFAEL